MSTYIEVGETNQSQNQAHLLFQLSEFDRHFFVWLFRELTRHYGELSFVLAVVAGILNSSQVTHLFDMLSKFRILPQDFAF